MLTAVSMRFSICLSSEDNLASVILFTHSPQATPTSFPALFPSHGKRPPREGKSPGNEVSLVGVACVLCVNKMADATLSSEDEEIENPIETAVSRGASLVEPEKASISQKRKVIVNSGQY